MRAIPTAPHQTSGLRCSEGRLTDRRLQTFGRVRAIDEDARTVEVVVSTGEVGRDGAIIDQSGWNFANYDRNPVVLWCHDDTSLPIARALPSRRTVTDSELIEVHEFATHPAANEVWDAVRGGFVNATSVRWIPGQTEIRKVEGRSVLVFTQGHELLESSYVPVPADPGCLVMRADGHPFQYRAEVKAGRMVIDYTMDCGVMGCPNSGWDGTVDVCEFHLRVMQAGEMPMPPMEDDEMPMPAPKGAVTDSLPARLAAFAAHVRESTQLLKGA